MVDKFPVTWKIWKKCQCLLILELAVKSLTMNACLIWRVGVRVLKNWHTDVEKIFPFSLKFKVLGMETVRWRCWYSAWLCRTNLPGFALQLKEREGKACSEDVLKTKFNWCSGDTSVSTTYRKPLKSMETHPQGQSQAEFLPVAVWDSWGDHNLKIWHNCPNHPRILRSEHPQVAWVGQRDD